LHGGEGEVSFLDVGFEFEKLLTFIRIKQNIKIMNRTIINQVDRQFPFGNKMNTAFKVVQIKLESIRNKSKSKEKNDEIDIIF
jgi:hypothetical protein